MLGSGTQADPYIIETLQDLQDMNLDLTAYYELGNNIDAAETATWNDNGDGTYAGFEPIGNSSSYFQGCFDGKDYTISNLYINRPDTDDVGLFGYIYDLDASPVSIIQNLTLKDPNINGNQRVGGLIGYVRPEHYTEGENTVIQNCIIDGADITSTLEPTGGLIGKIYRPYGLDRIQIIECHVLNSNIAARNAGIAGGLIGDSSNGIRLSRCTGINNILSARTVGGLIGDFYSNGYITAVTECKVKNNDITGHSGCYIGGLIGHIKSGTNTGNPAEINNCYVKDTILNNEIFITTEGVKGGLVGRLDNVDVVLSNSYAVFTPAGGGIAGGCVAAYVNGTAQDCYWDSEVSGVNADAAPTGTTGLTTVQMKDPANFTGWDFVTIWANDGVTNDGYHYLQAFAPPVTLPFSYWDGSVWIPVSEIKYCNGSEWIPVNNIKHWDGADWIEG